MQTLFESILPLAKILNAGWSTLNTDTICITNTILKQSLSSSSTEDQPQGELLKQKLPLEIRSVVYKEMPGEMMAGGLGAVRENDDQVTEVVHQIKPILERESGKKFEYLQVIHYKPQVVAGTNYFVKVSHAGLNSSHQPESMQEQPSNHLETF